MRVHSQSFFFGVALVIWCSFSFALPVYVGSGLGDYSGYTRYQFGGVTRSGMRETIFHFPVSELSFPVKEPLIKLFGER